MNTAARRLMGGVVRTRQPKPIGMDRETTVVGAVAAAWDGVALIHRMVRMNARCQISVGYYLES